jgi:hypothetical protein
MNECEELKFKEIQVKHLLQICEFWAVQELHSCLVQFSKFLNINMPGVIIFLCEILHCGCHDFATCNPLKPKLVKSKLYLKVHLLLQRKHNSSPLQSSVV